MKYFLLATFILSYWCLFDGAAQKRKKQHKSRKTQEETITDEDYFSELELVYDNQTYAENIRTVTLYKTGHPLSNNILLLKSDAALELGFDDLNAGIEDYNFKIIHCTSNWENSDLVESDFIEGFYDNQISNYQHSFNTLQSYTHYSAFFPQENCSITLSGNYLLVVYKNYDEEQIVLSRRFMVSENIVGVEPSIKPSSIIEDRDYRQEVDFTVNLSSANVINPYGNIDVVLQQNGRQDDLRTRMKPIFIRENELVYDFDDINVFDGNNEFRFFDFKSLRYQTINVLRYDKNDSTNFVYLKPEKKRTYSNYYNNPELNGRFMIDVEQGRNPNTDADYAYVTFTLEYPHQIAQADVYVLGALTDWQLRPEYRLQYNDSKGTYEGTFFLKQGYYNYQYAVLKDNKNVADIAAIEGTHFETENDYTVYVYYKDPETRHERLVGTKTFNSIRRN